MNMELITATSTALASLKKVLIARMDAPREEKEPLIQKILSDIAFMRERLLHISSDKLIDPVAKVC